MKSLIIATVAAVVLAGCAVGARVGPVSASVGVGVYYFDHDRGQHYHHDRHGNREYMPKGWKKPD